MDEIVFKTKPDIPTAILKILFSAVAVSLWAFIRTHDLFYTGKILGFALILFLIISFLLGGLLYHQIILYEDYILINQPIYLKFLNPKSFKYQLIKQVKI